MIVLMQCVAEAVMHKGVRGLAELVPGAPYLYEIAGDAVRRMKERKRAADLRNEVLSTANATLDEVKRTAAEVARDVAGAGPVEDRIALEMYLTQIPGTIRQSLKRADDPSGKTVPADFSLNGATELLRRLPQRVAKFRAGDSLPGKPGWKLIEFLGSGGFGEVWLARNPTLTALQGAVKFGLDPTARERLLRHEGSLINRVMEHGRHPNVVQLIDAHLEGDVPWLMYEYVPGGDLSGLVLAWQSLPADERVKRVLAALQTLACAVGHFHRLAPPLVHRDLKPANVLLGKVEGGGQKAELDSELRLPPSAFRLCVADFGIGGVAAAASLALEASRMGSTHSIMSQLGGSYTPLYASPQQQRGESPDPRDDVHALGVIGFQMLTGKLDATLGADYAKTLRRLGVSESLIELLGDCAAHDPENRLKDAAELAVRLEALGRVALPPTPRRQLVQSQTVNVSPKKANRDQQEKRQAEAIQAMAASVAANKQSWWTTRKLVALVVVGAQVMVVCIVALALLFGPGGIKPPLTATMATKESPQRKTAEFVRAIRIPAAKLGTLRISPEGKSIAIGGFADKSTAFLAVADLSNTTAKVRLDLEPGTNPNAFGFSPDSQRLVVATPTGAKVVSASNGSKLFDVPMAELDLRGCAVLVKVVEAMLPPLRVPELQLRPSWVGYSPDGSSVLVSAGWVFVRNVATPGADGKTLTDENGAVLRVDANSQFLFDSTLATAKHLAIVRPGIDSTAVFDVDSWKCRFQLGLAPPRLGAFSSTGASLATWHEAEMTNWSMNSGEGIRNYSTVPTGDPVQLLFAGDNRRIVAIGTKSALAYELERDESANWSVGREMKIVRGAFNPAGTIFAAVGEDGRIRIRKSPGLPEESDDVTGHTGKIHDIQFTSDGNTLVATGADGIFVWSVVNPKPVK
ncbi:MAG: protein kinase [Planctomycetes bacterium]|nr:protein kinase [Planctomycetota bacterium]